ncbi:hypothetical protein DFR58_13413 [Anaerobacterium chartisolvens]|uniref:Uncharacterized protein n=1 Tax=Anaerobacterium chartisolvens TaxID=1297424 RepID=A0A369AJM7_9FIRM|nr:hypothetical protein [Anaerobacterium chartisolvens]RCX09609.1 hypothetical protein DFR58_13413 [Anaerobacterium chartisolvens]
MSRKDILQEINRLIEEDGGALGIHDLAGLKAFLGEDSNKRLEVYDRIEELGSILIMGQGMW